MSRVREMEQQKAGHQLPQGAGMIASKTKKGSAHGSSHKKRKQP